MARHFRASSRILDSDDRHETAEPFLNVEKFQIGGISRRSGLIIAQRWRRHVVALDLSACFGGTHPDRVTNLADGMIAFRSGPGDQRRNTLCDCLQRFTFEPCDFGDRQP